MRTYNKSIPRYVGITDFTEVSQALGMRDVLRNATQRMKTPPVLMVGIMMSFKTLWNVPSKWTPIWPSKELLGDTFPPYETKGVLNTLHYADFEDHQNWPEEQNLFHSLAKAIDYARNNLHAIQLDMTWPSPGSIASAVHASRLVIPVILQVGRGALHQALYNPGIVADLLGDYTDVIDGVLIDQSMGEGKLMEVGLLESYIEAISLKHPKMHIAVAGGLSFTTLDVMVPLLEKFPNLSIDAQAGLRSSKNPMDPIEWEMAKSYLEKAGSLFTKYER